MGIIADNVVFDGFVPELDAIAAVFERRTGLHCRIAISPKHGFIVVKCREFYTDIDMHIHGRVVSLEQPISLSVYFFEELREALVEVGGRRAGFPLLDPREPMAPTRWRDRKWMLRAMDRHPMLTSLVWLALVLPAALYRRLFRK